jgi:hypothetical protein
VDFNLVNLKMTIRTDDPTALVRRLAGLGGGFAAACRGVACTRPTAVCDRCPGQPGCIWYGLFGQTLAADPAALRRHQKPPLPFAFSFPFPVPADGAGDVVECGLVVVGRAIPGLGMLLKGFEAFLEMAPGSEPAGIIRLASLDYQGERRTLGENARVTQPENLAVLSAAGVVESQPWSCSSLALTLHSPLRLLHNGRPCTSFEFGRFARSLFRRISSLAYYYGDRELGHDFRDLARQADAVACTDDRFCHGTQPGLGKRFAGLMGSGEFSGDFTGLMPFLVVGAMVQAGKGASYGMGRYSFAPL